MLVRCPKRETLLLSLARPFISISLSNISLSFNPSFVPKDLPAGSNLIELVLNDLWKAKANPSCPILSCGFSAKLAGRSGMCGIFFFFFQESLNHYRIKVAQALIWPMNVSETPLRGMFRVLVFDPAIMYTAWHACRLREKLDNAQSTRPNTT